MLPRRSAIRRGNGECRFASKANNACVHEQLAYVAPGGARQQALAGLPDPIWHCHQPARHSSHHLSPCGSVERSGRMSFLLFESASGYGLFEVTAADELAQVRESGCPGRAGGVGDPGMPPAARLERARRLGELASSAGNRWQPSAPLRQPVGRAWGRRRRCRLAGGLGASATAAACCSLPALRGCCAGRGCGAAGGQRHQALWQE